MLIRYLCTKGGKPIIKIPILLLLCCLLFLLLVYGSTNSKPLGSSRSFITYDVNYEYTCSSTGSTIEDCSKIAEFKDIIETDGVPVINADALAGVFNIPFIDDIFLKQVCVTMEPKPLPHVIYIALNTKVPGITNYSTRKQLVMKMLEKETCIIINNEDQRELINSTVRTIRLPEEKNSIQPSEEEQEKFVGLDKTYDDEENAITASYKIEYAAKALSLGIIYLISLWFSIFTFIAAKKQYEKLLKILNAKAKSWNYVSFMKCIHKLLSPNK